MNIRDWFVLVLVALLWIAATIYLFIHPSEADFATWGAICGTMTGAYRWLDLKDSKVPDACHTQ
jgi:hypothetical protein